MPPTEGTAFRIGCTRDQDSLCPDHSPGYQHCRWQRTRRGLQGQHSPESRGCGLCTVPQGHPAPQDLWRLEPVLPHDPGDPGERYAWPRGTGRARPAEQPGRAPHGAVRQRAPGRPGRAVSPEAPFQLSREKKNQKAETPPQATDKLAADKGSTMIVYHRRPERTLGARVSL